LPAEAVWIAPLLWLGIILAGSLWSPLTSIADTIDGYIPRPPRCDWLCPETPKHYVLDKRASTLSICTQLQAVQPSIFKDNRECQAAQTPEAWRRMEYENRLKSNCQALVEEFPDIMKGKNCSLGINQPIEFDPAGDVPMDWME
jgi:hypothetical protein